MEALFAFVILLFGILVVGALLGCVAFFRFQGLNLRIEALERQLHKLRSTRQNRVVETISAPQEEIVKSGYSNQQKRPDDFDVVEPIASTLLKESFAADEKAKDKDFGKTTANWLNSVKNNWMIWLGGICVGLAGIFLVRYSIETGLLGPAQRITAAVITGIGLHVLAEYLYRRTDSSHPAFAALAGGASITLYAALLAALHLYDLLNPGIVFGALAVVSFLTMLLALRYGPILAILGILGAYVVPMLVSSDSGNIVGALIYSLITSIAALALMRYVYRPWLWYGMMIGSIGWWVISLSTYQADGLRGIYLAALAYVFIAIPKFDWLLTRTEEPDEQAVRDKTTSFGWRFHPLQAGLTVIVLAQSLSIGWESFSSLALVTWAPLVILLVWVSAYRPSIKYLPWMSLVLQLAAWFYCGLDLDVSPVQLRGLELVTQNSFLIFASGMVAIYSGVSWWGTRKNTFSHIRSSLIYVAPVLWLALAYLLVTDLSVSWEWGVGSLILAMAYLTMSNIRLLKDPNDGDSVWLVLASHFAFSLAAAMFLRQASLTLVLATQIVSVVLIMNRHGVPALKWLVKGILALVVIRLTCNPWLLNYPVDIHWSLWTYGGTTLCCVLAAWLTDPESELKKWLEAVALHLFVLFLAAETRYWLYDGNIFVHDYTLLEATLNTLFWSLIGLAYYYRSRVSDLMSSYYNVCSRIMMVLAVLNYGIVLTVLNPLWGHQIVGTTLIWNILLPAYGGPMVVALLCLKFYDRRFYKYSAIMAGFCLFIFLCLEIRHLWQGALDLALPTSDGELYTYSVVWLILAIITILTAAKMDLGALYKAGMGLLLVVIAKIFLVDMSDLEGLLRVASFMGLGLSLLGLAYLYQKILKTSAGEAGEGGERKT